MSAFPYSVWSQSVTGATLHLGFDDADEARTAYEHYSLLGETYQTIFYCWSGGQAIELDAYLCPPVVCVKGGA